MPTTSPLRKQGDEKVTTIEQVKQFLKGSETLRFEGVSVEERYRWIESVLVKFMYPHP